MSDAETDVLREMNSKLRTFERLLQLTPETKEYAIVRFVYFVACERTARDIARRIASNDRRT